MSKRKHDDEYYCCQMVPCCNCCCSNNPGYGGLGNFGGFGGFGNSCGNNNWNNGILEAIIFWLIACGAGILNNNSILIILLFLLYGWSCNDGGFGLFGW